MLTDARRHVSRARADGDSVTAIEARGTKLHRRLLGIDALEIAHGTKLGQPFGKEARDPKNRTREQQPRGEPNGEEDASTRVEGGASGLPRALREGKTGRIVRGTSVGS